MPRFPDPLIAQLKRDVSLVRLAEAAGLALASSGKDLRGKCPFHPDDTPSLVIDPAKNLFHCFGCGAAGSPIDWIQRLHGLSFRHAVELLRADLPGLLENAPSRPLKRSTRRQLPPAVSRSASDTELLDQIAGFYHQKLLDTPSALAYLQSRSLADPETIQHFRLGYVDRTLGLTLPEKSRKAGADLRSRLKALGILRPRSGHERFRGCITVPLADAHGRTVSFYGRRIDFSAWRARSAEPDPDADPLDDLPHLYLPGPGRPVFNPAALSAADELLLCESPFDALTFWAAGFRNVTCAYGASGFTPAHHEAFRTHRIRRVLIAYDNDPAGNSAAARLAEKLTADGIECFRIRLPHGMDINAYATQVRPAAKSLAIAIRSAEWLGKGTAPAIASAPIPVRFTGQARTAGDDTGETRDTAAPAADNTAELPTDSRTAPQAPPPSSFAAETIDPVPSAEATLERPPTAEPSDAPTATETPAPAAPTRTPPVASPVPALPAPPPLTRVSDSEVTFTAADRAYRVRGLAQNTRFDALRVNLFVSSPAGFHVDTLDLFNHRARTSFEKFAALELGCPEPLLHADLGGLLRALDALTEEAAKKAAPPTPSVPTLSETDREAALEFLRDPRLLDRLLDDFTAAGIIGEEINKLAAYLAATSRKLPRPLAVVVQSTSAAGKSTLMDAVLDLLPPEDCEHFSAMTAQALFYMGKTGLAHKVLAISEEEGAERASYALKLLQSEGRLSIASTGKDPATGKHVTHEYEVEGPVAILLTTTASDLDEELQNRCLILSVDEDRRQTRAIHQIQRSRRSLEGLLAAEQKADILALHRNAQRLLRPLAIVNPFVHHLTFSDEKTRTRRDHEKYLTLIDTIALLHQHQRPIRTAGRADGKTVQYLEVTLADLRTANRLADVVLGRSLDELPPQTRRLLELIEAFVSQRCAELACSRGDLRFSRREVREATGFSDFQLRTHLERLVALEYLLVHRGMRGQSFVYELLYDGRGADGRPFLPGLIDVDALEAELAREADAPPAPGAHDYAEKFEGATAEFEPRASQNEPASRAQRAPNEPPTRPTSDCDKPHPKSSSPGRPPSPAKNTDPATPARRNRTSRSAGANGGSHPTAPRAASAGRPAPSGSKAS